MAGVLRIVDHVKALPDDICDDFLDRSLSSGGVLYRPKILCIGKMNHWSTDIWEKSGNQAFVHLNDTNERDQLIKRHHYGEYLGFGGYVASAGTCSGDSGGPVYQEETDPESGNKTYVVTGIIILIVR